MTVTESTTAKPAAPAKKVVARKAAPAKKAPAKKVAAKPVAKKASSTAGKKIRWAVGQIFPNGKNQAGTGHGGTQYAIVRAANGEFQAVAKTAKGQTELVQGSFSAAYWAAVNHNKTAVDKAAEAASKRTTK